MKDNIKSKIVNKKKSLKNRWNDFKLVVKLKFEAAKDWIIENPQAFMVVVIAIAKAAKYVLKNIVLPILRLFKDAHDKRYKDTTYYNPQHRVREKLRRPLDSDDLYDIERLREEGYSCHDALDYLNLLK